MLEKLMTLSYLWIGRRLEKKFNENSWLTRMLERAAIRISPATYAGTAILVSLITLLGAAVPLSLILLLVFNLGILSLLPLLFWVPIPLGFLAYPFFRQAGRKEKIDGALPFAAGYMSVLASVGIPPDKLFESLARQNLGEVSEEAKMIVRDMYFLGLDFLSAIKRAADRTPSSTFRDFLDGIRVTLLSGGSLARYLEEQTVSLMKLREEKEREFIKSLGIFGEMYVVLVVLAPLLFIVLLIFLGSSAGIPIPLPVLLMLIAYFLIPLAGIIVITLLEMSMPKGE
ncbi:MAG: type II secretion system F family protein [Candidatus Baldrarchaeia archaeon]